MVDARLPDGSRVNAIISPLSLSGPLLTIRRFSQKRFDLEDLVNIGTLSARVGRLPLRCIEAELNILVSGGTGTGKTTMLNALSAAVPERDRIVTIEDAAELQLKQQHVLRLESRPKNIEGEGEVTIRDLVRNALRMRPDRIIVGEVRGAEALDMLQAMNTGHEGSLSTIHANSPRDALEPPRDDGADGGLRPAGARDPAAHLVGARPDRADRAARRRHASRHRGQRGAADGGRRDHAAAAVRVQARAVHRRRQGHRRLLPTGLRPSSCTSSRSTGSSCRTTSSGRRPTATNVADLRW